MEDRRYFAYMRISTKEERGLQRYNRQEKSLARFEKEHGIEFIFTAKEDESGKSFDGRKEWQKLERLVQSGDTIVFKDISRFTREAENGYQKYMELLNRGVELIFIDNPTVSTDYIRQLLDVAKKQNLVAKTSLESTVKLLIIVELDRVEQERLTLIKRITDGQKASSKKCGRPTGKVDKLTKELEHDIRIYLTDRNVKQVDLLRKHHISKNTFIKYKGIIEASGDTSCCN